MVATVGVLVARPAVHHARATSLLLSFADASRAPAVMEDRIVFQHGGEAIPARLYAPPTAAKAPGVVLVHGVHRLGIDEPRLERFARALADTGIHVMTPLVRELSDYKVTPSSVDTIGAAVSALRARLGVEKVGLMGMSFGGGLSLLAAADPRFAGDVAFVVAVGAHDDLSRVSRFFVEGEIQEPSGATRALRAHDYGAMVLVHANIEDFFPEEDAPAAADAVRLWLWEEQAEARAAAEALSPESRAKLDRLFEGGTASLEGELLASIAKRRAELEAVSPRGRLGSLRAPVYLLHGEGDRVIPSTEALWLATSVPPDRLRAALVSPAIEHVELRAPTVTDKIALVHFMGRVIGEAAAHR